MQTSKSVPSAPSDWRSLWPGGLVSLCLHAVLLVLASISLRGCERGAPAQAGGRDYREVGLAVVPDRSEPAAEQAQQNPQDQTADTPAEQLPEESEVPTQSLPTEAPDVADLLGQQSTAAATPSERTLPDTIGPGMLPGGLPQAGAGIPELIRPRAAPGQGAAGSLTPGPNTTSFMNIVGNGRNFVYVIDVSSSMGNGGRLDLARSQLKGSLRMLKANQRFQILFYNETTTQMKLRNRPAEDLFVADAVQIQLAEQEIDRVTATSGTEHLQPVLHALRLQPDVVYFLTDGDQPQLSRRDLETVRRQNRSGACIHVIEFASTAKESREVSWLQLLASQSGGKYSYIPVR
ncbi:MAG: hypothetical protein RIK87_30730 [Fuerstiella sp.]